MVVLILHAITCVFTAERYEVNNSVDVLYIEEGI
jgi:hypothetical protein